MSHAITVETTDQIAFFRAYDTDGTAKTDLTSATTGLSLSVFRVGATAVSIASLSDKAADNTAHADGAIRAVSGNLYSVDLPDAAQATWVPSIAVKGSYTGGVIEGVPHPVVGYPPAISYAVATALATVGANVLSVLEDTGTTIPATLATLSTLNAAGIRTAVGLAAADLDTQLGAIVADTNELQTDWADGGRLDLLLDTAAAVSGGATAQQVWEYGTRTLTQTAAQIAAAVAGSTITIHRGDSLSATLTGIGSVAARSKLWLTVKRRSEDTDAQSVIQMTEAGGLVVLNGSSTVTSGNGSITVDDEDDGDITIALGEAETAALAPVKSLCYDVQMLDSSGNVTTLVEGIVAVNADITRATS